MKTLRTTLMLALALALHSSAPLNAQTTPAQPVISVTLLGTGVPLLDPAAYLASGRVNAGLLISAGDRTHAVRLRTGYRHPPPAVPVVRLPTPTSRSTKCSSAICTAITSPRSIFPLLVPPWLPLPQTGQAAPELNSRADRHSDAAKRNHNDSGRQSFTGPCRSGNNRPGPASRACGWHWPEPADGLPEPPPCGTRAG